MKEANQVHTDQFWGEVTFSPISLCQNKSQVQGVFWLPDLHCTMKTLVPFPLKDLYLLLFNDILFL